MFAWPAHEHRFAPVLFETMSPSFGHCEYSLGRGVSGVGFGVGLDSGEGVDSAGLITGFNSGFTAALTVKPLFQTNLFPDFMQVYFLPPVVEVAPALVHLAPALTAANEGAVISEIATTKAKKRRERFMAKRYQSANPNQIANWSKTWKVEVTYCF